MSIARLVAAGSVVLTLLLGGVALATTAVASTPTASVHPAGCTGEQCK